MVNIGSSQAWQGADGARRRDIYHRLERVSTTAAAFWHDACFLVAVGGLLHVSTHLVGHALREVDGVLLEVLLPDGTVLPNEESRVARVDAIAPTLGLDASVTQFWRGLELHKVAHRHPPFPRIDDDEIGVLLDDYSKLLEIVSSEFERRFTIWVERLDTFLAMQKPTKAIVTRLRKEIPWSAVTLHYFFDRLAGPQWLSPLVKAKFFETLPDVVFDEASGTTRFPLWPQAAYLRGVAAVDGEAVSKVVTRLPPSSNPWVTSALIEIAIALPPGCRREVHDRIMGAIRESDALFLSLDLIEKFAASYVNDGLSEQALDLVAEVLSVENVTTGASANAVQLERSDDRCWWFGGLGPFGVSGSFDVPFGHLAFDQARV